MSASWRQQKHKVTDTLQDDTNTLQKNKVTNILQDDTNTLQKNKVTNTLQKNNKVFKILTKLLLPASMIYPETRDLPAAYDWRLATKLNPDELSLKRKTNQVICDVTRLPHNIKFC